VVIELLGKVYRFGERRVSRLRRRVQRGDYLAAEGAPLVGSEGQRSLAVTLPNPPYESGACARGIHADMRIHVYTQTHSSRPYLPRSLQAPSLSVRSRAHQRTAL
jgi:hypothetical protein